MASIVRNCGPLLATITANARKNNVHSMSVRHKWKEGRHAINPRNPREPDFRRKQMLAICEPVLPRDKRQQSEKCYNLTPFAPREIHPYDKLLAEDMRQELRSSRMICFLHTNSMKSRERTECANHFTHQDMSLRFYNEDVATLAMARTKYESALHLCRIGDWWTEKYVTVLFSAEPEVAKILKAVKKFPQLILMAAIIDDRFLSVEDINNYNRMPNIETLRAQVSHTLSLAAQTVVGNTGHPMRELSQSLDLYINDQKK